MKRVDSIEGLVLVWGRTLRSEDPIRALAAQGLTISDELQAQLTAGQTKRVSAEARARLVESFGDLDLSAVRLAVNPLGFTPRSIELPEGEWDLIVGIRLSLVDQVLAGLYATRVWPNELRPTDVQSLIELDDLRALSDDVPEIEGLGIGTLRLPEPPTTSAGVEGRLSVNQHFILDLDVPSADFPPITTVSSLDATLRFNAAVSARRIAEEELVIELGTLPADISATTLEISPDSPIQPRDESALRTFTDKIAEELTAQFLSNRPSVCPNIQVPVAPVDGKATLQIQRVDVRALSAPETGTLAIGVLIGTDAVPDADSGSAAVLQVAPSFSESVNVSLRVHEVLLNKLAKEGVRTGGIEIPDINTEKFGIDFDIDVEINDIDIDLRPLNNIDLKVDAKFVDFCGPGPIDFIDLDFDLTGSAEIQVFDERIRILGPENLDIDYDNSDLALCALTSAIDLATISWGLDLIPDIAEAGLIDIVVGRIDALDKTRRGVFNLGENIPGTELAPRLEVLQVLVEEEVLKVDGRLTLAEDQDHIFIYAKVAERSPIPFRLGPPIPRALVEVVDQDAPQILGGEIGVPEEGTTTTIKNNVETTRTVEVRDPSTDEILVSATSDRDGLVRPVVDRRSVGGIVRVTKTSERLDEDNPTPVTRVFSFPFAEVRPDIFFRVTLPDGRVFDSRQRAGGLFFAVNVNDRRVGSPDAPVLLSLSTEPSGPGPRLP